MAAMIDRGDRPSASLTRRRVFATRLLGVADKVL